MIVGLAAELYITCRSYHVIKSINQTKHTHNVCIDLTILSLFLSLSLASAQESRTVSSPSRHTARDKVTGKFSKTDSLSSEASSSLSKFPSKRSSGVLPDSHEKFSMSFSNTDKRKSGSSGNGKCVAEKSKSSSSSSRSHHVEVAGLTLGTGCGTDKSHSEIDVMFTCMCKIG